ncbi:EscU/YscU/HrcU family type III secretion system export apparatus switch protein [Gayadomonas joobiniege]|uniref:EscU/YscU/HrcU family type III secretion system export apparatus switch protein n=1 Tax=Gayadomonas joobiniege TaxID=1234606 RepID=UPI0003636468|nr:EscU/YscU/HrcU family type III secretion system export apparatus switch protein [Gayadomonas joobiniege]
MKPPIKKAVSIYYPAPDAPKIAAKGYQQNADDIINTAREQGLLVHEDSQLADYLCTLDIGSQIDPDAYLIIAELIAWSYIMRGLKPDSWTNHHNKVDDKV